VADPGAVGGARPITTAQVVAFAVHGAALVATPLRRRGRRAGLAVAVVGGLAASTTTACVRRWGVARALGALGTVAVSTTALERVGTTTGVPFGRYQYTGALRPSAAGVPVVVPFAWFAMAVPAREAAHAALGARSTRLRRIGLGAAYLTAWDLFLDPQMVAEGYWRWARRGRYRGIPWTNFAGWLVASAAVQTVLELLLPPGDPEPSLVGSYGWMSVMQTVGFARYFDDRVVASVGGAAMLPASAAAVAGLVWGRRARG
jgi:putative membrane protein